MSYNVAKLRGGAVASDVDITNVTLESGSVMNGNSAGQNVSSGPRTSWFYGCMFLQPEFLHAPANCKLLAAYQGPFRRTSAFLPRSC